MVGAACASSSHAQAQVSSGLARFSPSTVVSTYGRTPTNYQMVGPENVSAMHVSVDVFGKPCLTIGGYGRPLLSNPNLYEHVLVATNKCVKRIRFEACYRGTRSCVEGDLAANQQRKEAILGIQPANKDFIFEFRERF